MAEEKRHKPEDVAWDRVGQLFGDMADLAQKIGNRNLDLWQTVSNNIRTKEKYGADDVASDTSRAVAVALDNIDDIWTSLTRMPDRERVARALPTAFLFFALRDRDEAVHALADPVWIHLGPAELEDLPDEARLNVSGSKKGVAALMECIRVRKAHSGYVLETFGAQSLVPGVYGGAVFVTEPQPRLLADLRIVVEGQS